MAFTFDPLASTLLTAPAASISISAIPSTYTDLVLVLVGSDTNTSNGYCKVQVNGDTGTNYSRVYVAGTGTATSGGRGNSLTEFYVDFGSGTNIGRGMIHFMSYSQANTNKVMLVAGGNAAGSIIRQVALWRSNAAISSIVLSASSTTIAADTRVDLFGVKAA